MSWISLAVNLMKLASLIIGEIRVQRAFNAGEDKAVAEASLAILRKTEQGKQIDAAIAAMSDADRKKLLTDLEG